MATNFEKEPEMRPLRPGGYRPIPEEKFGGPLFTQAQIEQAEQQGEEPVRLSDYGLGIREDDKHFEQVQLLWRTFGLKLSLDEEGHVVFPANQIRNLDQAFTDTKFIIYDHLNSGTEAVNAVGRAQYEIQKEKISRKGA